jgi:pimeloyl-ACP methyl ester carboxylesterase
VVVGFSMGSMVAVEAAVRAGDRIAGLVLEGSGLLTEDGREVFRRRADAVDAAGLGDALDDHVRRAFSAAYVEAHSGEIAKYTDEARKADPRAVTETFRSVAAWGPPAEAATARWPVLLVNGDQDGLFTPDAARALGAGLLHAEQEVIERAGHTAHFEQPERFNAMICGFLASTSGARQ